MKKRVRENISAYLDGEAQDAQSIARLIANSPEAAREHAAVAELSARIRSFEAPEIHPAFAARVLATIEEQRAPRRAPWRLPLGLSAAAAALIAALLYFPALNSSTPAPTATAQAPASAPAQDEAQMLAELERRVAQDSSLQHFVVARFDNAPQTSDLYSERLIAAVAGSQRGAAAGDAFAHGIDYRAAVQRMDNAQADAFKQFLSDSVREAHEG